MSAAAPVIEGRFVEVQPGVRLHYASCGDATKPLMLMLHGFPEYWGAWRHVMPAFADDFHVVAPDLRGYNLSDKPAGIDAYAIDTVADDIAGVIEAEGGDQAMVAGHDWGGLAAWLLAMRRPELVERLAVLNTPHPARFTRRLLVSPQQMARSSYMFAFQLPWLPERLFRARDFSLARQTFRYDPYRVDAFTDADLDCYVDAWEQPGALAGSLNYYRAATRHGARALAGSMRRIEQPVLVIWGDRDRYLLRDLAEPDPELVPNAEVVHISHASHWIQHDEPDEVNRLLLQFLTMGGSLDSMHAAPSP